VTLVDRYHGPLVRLAWSFVNSREAAEDVVQETWLAVLTGIGRFQRRSSLKSWLFAILANQARARAKRDARSVPFSVLAAREAGEDAPGVDPGRFQRVGEPEPGAWTSAPASWVEQPEGRLLSAEVMAVVSAAIDALPPAQRAAILMRDVHLMEPDKVCSALGVSDTNQRVLLHRARAKVRQAVEQYLGGGAGS